ncbi:MAG: phosphoglucosamine mutase [Lactobacillus sp.]|uniref:Phosphoglucosamine mutase n=1 Tax=Bombilactobacillus bombi TaxID=1303590 RepID=A0A347SRU0_9LACO|nr:phosphoglucosamine mutase [Bombilactobacillus bombi]AXX64749.1 phosphoglucosamine mutase [Bombilactobacillus bombi]MCO6541995.1 phosphoglucosamine mutase [Lactobacillus sp.]MCO6542679.1 phosphoglucosamine mutase [Lactobacillus sp.]RHW50075.1 phosphoglucosamine mutase [Bombilactobacillus bombi]
MVKYFGTDGVRGVANKELTPELAFKLGRAGGYVLSEQKDNDDDRATVLVARDTRKSGQMLEMALISGLLSVGIEVLDLGVITTPAVAYLVKVQDADAGIMISASHNPASDNGIKFFGSDGYKLKDATEAEIEHFLDQEVDSLPRPAAEGLGTLESYKEGSLKYLEFLRQSISDDLSGMKIVLDGANGSTSKLLTKLYADLNVEFTTIATNPDGININDGVGSTHPDKLAREVVAQEAQAGLAFDGDGDRCIAVDEKGNIVDGDKIMYILGKYFKDHGRLKKDTIVTTVMSNLGLYKAIEAADMKSVQTAVGDRHVAEEIVQNGYNLGGEQSGHIIIFDVHNTGDGMLTGIQLLNVMKQTGKKLSELAAPVKTYPQKLVNIKVTDKENWKNYPAIQEAIDTVEKEMNGDGRVLVRPSGTEPLLRVMVEAASEEKANQYTEQIAQVVQAKMGL